GAWIGRVADVRNNVSCGGFAQTGADGFVLHSVHAFLDGNATGGAWRQFRGSCPRGRDTGNLRPISCSYRNHVFFVDGAAGAAARDAVLLLRAALLLRFVPASHLPCDKQARAARIRIRVWLLLLST